MLDPETFRSLLHDRAHWEFELFVGGIEMIVFDLIIGVIIAPFVLKHWKHHLARDKRESVEVCKRLPPHRCRMNGPCNGWPRD